MYIGFQSVQILSEQARYDFQCAVLHPKTGLCANILKLPNSGIKIIVLRSDPSLDLSRLLDFLAQNMTISNKEEFSKAEIDLIQESMTTEWDRNMIKYILSKTRTASAMESLGVRGETTQKRKTHIPTVLEAVSNSKFTGEDIVRVKINQKMEDIRSWIKRDEELLRKRDETWSKVRLDELQDKINSDQDRLMELENIQTGSSKTHKQRLQQMSKRQARQLLAVNRIGKRKLGDQGRKPLIDSDTEEKIAKAIEDKATYHGRRHNTTMYTNRLVKVADLPGIANHFLALDGKPLITSKTTVWNRSENRRKNSIQAKLHLGKGLFCTKKPPKTESCENESTHHQRAHVNNVKMFFFSQRNEKNRKYCLCQSVDDKAYIRPGTGEGMNHARNQRILQPSAEEKSRKLPIHDWPEKKMYITPSAHRIFSKIGQTIDGTEKLITEDDYHFVFVRPKFFIGSSGTVWASETANLRYLYPSIFEIPDNKHDYSSALQ
jgi:hypothetical protein